MQKALATYIHVMFAFNGQIYYSCIITLSCKENAKGQIENLNLLLIAEKQWYFHNLNG